MIGRSFRLIRPVVITLNYSGALKFDLSSKDSLVDKASEFGKSLLGLNDVLLELSAVELRRGYVAGLLSAVSYCVFYCE